MTLRESILRIVMPLLQPQNVVGKVKAVDANARTCDVEVGGSYTRLGVRLRAIEDGAQKGFILYPKVNSYVHISMSDGNRNIWYLSMASEVDNIELNGGQFGGLIKIQDLVDKVNRLENKVNDHINLFNAHIHDVPQAPSGTLPSAPTLSQDTPIAPLTQVSDLENPIVKHGQ